MFYWGGLQIHSWKSNLTKSYIKHLSWHHVIVVCSLRKSFICCLKLQVLSAPFCNIASLDNPFPSVSKSWHHVIVVCSLRKSFICCLKLQVLSAPFCNIASLDNPFPSVSKFCGDLVVHQLYSKNVQFSICSLSIPSSLVTPCNGRLWTKLVILFVDQPSAIIGLTHFIQLSNFFIRQNYSTL